MMHGVTMKFTTSIFTVQHMHYDTEDFMWYFLQNKNDLKNTVF